MNELGGFAQNPEDIDGTEEDLRIFNHCLAYDYYAAVVGEDFDSLGECLNDGSAWRDLMNEVTFWLLDAETDVDIKDNLNNLYYGTIITYKNRTFIEACRSHGWNDLAIYLSKGIKKKAKI